MDYKYIESLLARFWKCELSLEEESTLRTFFCQKDIPQYFEKYRSLFAYEDHAAEIEIGADFDEKILGIIERQTVHARRIPTGIRLRPFFKAAAVVAIVITLGTAVQHSFQNESDSTPDYNYATYEDTYKDPQVAYEKVSSAFHSMSYELREKLKADSINMIGKEKSVQ